MLSMAQAPVLLFLEFLLEVTLISSHKISLKYKSLDKVYQISEYTE